MSDGPRDSREGKPTMSEIKLAFLKPVRVRKRAASTLAAALTDIRTHSGNKYIRVIKPCIPGLPETSVDVYAVLDAFMVTNPAIAHAVKKLLCAGIRGKADITTDLRESIDCIRRAIEMVTPPAG